MNKFGIRLCFGLTLALAALRLGAEPARTAAPAVAKKIGFEVLKGSWVRPDGGYMIEIRETGQGGQLEASYFNPNQLPFSAAKASLAGTALHVFFELRAGGYGGSTYELVYDPASDQLKGTYYQAVARQKYDVFFVRK